jgi:hypothetical protein
MLKRRRIGYFLNTFALIPCVSMVIRRNFAKFGSDHTEKGFSRSLNLWKLVLELLLRLDLEAGFGEVGQCQRKLHQGHEDSLHVKANAAASVALPKDIRDRSLIARRFWLHSTHILGSQIGFSGLIVFRSPLLSEPSSG